VSAPRRVVLCTAARRPYPGDAASGELVLDAGSVDEPRPGEQRIAARDLLPAAEAAALQQACLRFVTGWHTGRAPLRGAGFNAGRAIESRVLIDLGAALKHLVLLQRLAAAHGPLRVLADTNQPALEVIREVLQRGNPPVVLEDAVPRWMPPLRQAAARVRSTLLPRATGDARDVRAAAVPPDAEGRSPHPRIRVWWLTNYRNRALLDRLGSDPRFDVRRFERGEENRYLTGALAGDVESLGHDALERSLQDLRDAGPAIEALAAQELAGLGGAAEVAQVVFTRAVEAMMAATATAAEGWRRLLRADRPDLIVGGIPWGGDLRVLALLAAHAGIPFTAVQDGALSEAGAGGVPVGSAALAWGPMGADWFARRGFPRAAIHAVGDPYLDVVRARVAEGPSQPLRERLRIPAGQRVLVASVQNSAPHHLETDPADPVRAARMLLAAFEQGAAPGWTLVLKLHPRLVLVDGRRRVDLFRRMTRSVEAARIAGPEEDPVKVLALADAHVGEGDTLSLEAIACGKPAILLERAGLPLSYPEFRDSGAMAVARSPRDLAARLAAGPVLDPAAARRLLELHFRADAAPADALARLAGDARRASASEEAS
jgi:hypothetical protein